MRDLLRLLALMRPHTGWMLLGLLASLATLVANVGLLTVSGWFIAAMAVAGASGAPINYYTPAALIRAFAILRSAGRYVERLVTHDATFRLLASLRVWLFEHLEPLAPAGLQRERSGDLLSRIRADIDTLENLYVRMLIPVAVAVLGVAAAVAFLAVFDGGLALLTLAGLLLAGVALPLGIQRLSARASAERVTRAAALRTALIDGVQGMGELAVYGQAPRQARLVDELSTGWVAAQRRLAELQGLSQALTGLLANLTLWGGLILMVPLVTSGALDGPGLAMLALFLLACFEAVAPLPQAFQLLGGTLVAARRLFAIVDARPAVIEPEAPSPVPDGFALVLDGVSLRYGPDRPRALRDISLRLGPGEALALVGPTGSGKTSLVNLLLRFWDYESGSAQLGGQELRLFRGSELRRHIAVASQDSHLFNTSIRENLLLAAPDAKDEALRQACELAQVHAFIADLPDGYDTQLGEAGVRLSGGQARRLAIARALLRNAPILILDEPTEGLDPTTANALMRAVREAMSDRSLLVITHRAADLAAMARIVFLEQGAIIDQGTHRHMSQHCLPYRRLVERLGDAASAAGTIEPRRDPPCRV